MLTFFLLMSMGSMSSMLLSGDIEQLANDLSEFSLSKTHVKNMLVTPRSNQLQDRSQKNRYRFHKSDFDKAIFSNSHQGTVELIYPTSLVESVSNQQVLVMGACIEPLVNYAILRIEHKKNQVSLDNNPYGPCPICDIPPQAFEPASPNQFERLKKYTVEERAKFSEYLDKIHTKLNLFKSLIIANNPSNILIPANDLMFIIQYSAHRIDHENSMSTVTIVHDYLSSYFFYGNACNLLKECRLEERPTCILD